MGKRWTFIKDPNKHGNLDEVPELIALGRDDIRKALPLVEHEHPGCYEFVLVERGKAGWELNGTIYETRAGDMFHTRPGERHRGSLNVIEPSIIWWLIVMAPDENGPDWLRLTAEEQARMDAALKQLPRVTRIGLEPVASLRRLQTSLQGDSPLRSIEMRQAMLDVLLRVIGPSAGRPPLESDLLQRFEELITLMRQAPEWRPSVQELADAAGISASHFYRTFQFHTGQSPMNFMERLRLQQACSHLTDTDMLITEIAFRLGYPSSQHFATVFRRFIGMTPTAFRHLVPTPDDQGS